MEKSKAKTYAEFHYWETNISGVMRGYIVDGIQCKYPEFEFKKDMLDSLVEGFKTSFPGLLRCEHRLY